MKKIIFVLLFIPAIAGAQSSMDKFYGSSVTRAYGADTLVGYQAAETTGDGWAGMITKSGTDTTLFITDATGYGIIYNSNNNIRFDATNVGIAAAGVTAYDASSILTASSTTKGVLIPRMTAAQKSAIVSPATGLLIFQTDATAGYYYYTGSVWVLLLNNTGSANTIPYYNSSGLITSSGSLTYTGSVFTSRLSATGHQVISNADLFGLGIPFAGAAVADSANNIVLFNGVSTVGNKTATMDCWNYVTGQESEVSVNYFASTGWQGILIKGAGTTGQSMDAITLRPNQTMVFGSADDADSCLFCGSSWNGSANVERFRFAQNGYVGIGTTTPVAPLDIQKEFIDASAGIGISVTPTYANSTDNDGTYVAGRFAVEKTDNNSEAGGNLLGINVDVIQSGSGNFNSGGNLFVSVENAGAGVLSQAYGCVSNIDNTGGGSITTAYNYKVETNDATTAWGFYNDVAGVNNKLTQTQFTEDITFTTKTINTTSGDAATINSPAGRFRKDNSGAAFTLTNSFITANSIILLTPANAAIDATATTWTVSAGAGAGTITFDAVPTGDFDMNFLVIN